MLDLLITNAQICDGLGTPCWRGMLGVTGDRISYLGRVAVPAARVVEGSGLVLAPGFIDPHTHYDAQLCWDPALTPSSWHGVTTVIIGNCGVGIAPTAPNMREALLRDLENVEGIPYEVLRQAIAWQWTGFGEYLDFVHRQRPAINVAALVSLTALRHAAMGEEAAERAAGPAELVQMQELLREAFAAGAFGFSTDYLADHLGYKGRPLACQAASAAELFALCQVARDAECGTLSVAVNSMHSGTKLISDHDVELLRTLARDSARPVTFLPVLAVGGQPAFHQQTLAKIGTPGARIVPQMSVSPFVFTQTLRKPFKFGYYHSFRQAMNRPLAEQLALYGSPAWRKQARDELAHHERRYPWERTRVLTVANPALAGYVGPTLAELARAENVDPVEMLAEIACRDQLATRFQVEKSNWDLAGIDWMLQRDEFLVGLSDGGAHVDQLCDARYSSVLLQRFVRERAVLTLEQAIRKLTSIPAQLYGIPERGVLAEGLIADLVLFDPTTVAAETPRLVSDLPAGAERLVANAQGIVAVFVAGEQILSDGELTGVRAGAVLRSTNR
jgi:N-acyl-D-aspartate/D-glutamate deacylase